MSARVEVLGPLRLVVDGVAVDVPGPRRRAVLALLALAGGRAVTVDELLDAVWPDELPDSGRRALHSHVSRLRGHLGPHAERLERVGNGYRLDVEVDLDDARAAAREGGDVGRLGAVLAGWRGTALDEFPDVAPLAAAATAAAALRLDLVDAWLEARLAAGGDPSLVDDATRAAAESPLRERTAVCLVRALGDAGRQADAMRAAHAFRSALVEATGFDPSPALAEAERDVAAGMPMARRPVVRPDGPLLGRETELALLHERLDGARLVTVVGPGGVGKTRLVGEVAAERAAAGGEVAVVHLAAAVDDRRAMDALGDALGLTVADHDRLLDAAVAVLATRPMLLVLDNCEHLLGACRELIAALLPSAPGLTVLATSREPLGLPAERVARLEPLGERPAVEAFVAHARRHDPDFVVDDHAAVADVVQRLDGLPLALELAAGRVASLGLADLRDRLGRALDLLAGARPEVDARHRTLRSTIEWSYRLLEDDERRLLRAVAMLPGGFDLATAELLAQRLGIGGDAAASVARLVDASVVVADAPPGRRRRYRLLATVRAFALEDLGVSGERSAVEAAVVAWAVALAEQLELAMRGPDEAVANERLHTELPNLRAARDLAAERDDIDALVDLCLHLDLLTLFRGLPDVWSWAIELAVRPDLDHLPRRAALLGAGARGAWLRGELQLAERLAQAAVDGSDRWHGGRHRGLEVLATVALFRDEPLRARDLYLESVANGSPRWASGLASAALAACYGGDLDGARSLLVQAQADAEAAGAGTALAYCDYVRGELQSLDDPVAAIASYEAAVAEARRCGATFVEGVATVGLVSVRGRTGELAPALEGYRWLLDHWRRAGSWVQLWTTVRNLAAALADVDPGCAGVLLLAAAHAEEAALVDAGAAAAEAALLERIRTAVGDDELERIRTRAVSIDRSAVVDEALAAIEAALGA